MLKETQGFVGDLCECRGSVGTLWKTKNADYSFLSDLKEMIGHMDDCPHAESMVPLIKRRMWGLWDPIPISPDTEEARINVAGEEEVDQPPSTFGASMSGNFELDP